MMGEASAAAASAPWRIVSGGLAVDIRLTPKGGRDAIDGIECLADGRAVLRARVRAAPVEGAANAALVKLMAAAVSTAPCHVSVTAGASGRVKRITIAGDGRMLAAALARTVAGRAQ
jgi:uncharacterized protein